MGPLISFKLCLQYRLTKDRISVDLPVCDNRLENIIVWPWRVYDYVLQEGLRRLQRLVAAQEVYDRLTAHEVVSRQDQNYVELVFPHVLRFGK